MGGIFLGIILGLIGLFLDGRKGWAIAATILAGLYALMVVGSIIIDTFIL